MVFEGICCRARSGKVNTRAFQNRGGIVANLARSPKGGDRDQIKAVAAGEGDVGVVNSYYLGKMLQDENQVAWASAHLIAAIKYAVALGGRRCGGVLTVP